MRRLHFCKVEASNGLWASYTVHYMAAALSSHFPTSLRAGVKPWALSSNLLAGTLDL